MKPVKLLLLFILLLSPLSAFAQDSVYKVIDFNKPSDPVAAKVLFNYALDNCSYPEVYNEIKEEGESAIKAHQIDLNDDGINETIGFCVHQYYGNYWGDLSIFILSKTDKGYIDISLALGRVTKVIVLNKKTNGYRNIKIEVYDHKKQTFKTTEICFNGKYYEFIQKG